MDYDYLLFLYFATIITPSVLLAAFYAHIYRVVVKQMSEVVRVSPGGKGRRGGGGGGTMLRVLGAAQKREVKATQNLAIIVFFFMICWIPLYTINAVKAFRPDVDIHAAVTEFCIILSHLNSAVNPLLYAYHLKDFRAALESLICGARRPPPVCYKPSLASARATLERCNALRDRPRLYVDSPVWLRQREAEREAASAPAATPPTDAQPFLATSASPAGPYLISEERGERSPYRRVEELLRRVRSAGAAADS